MKRGTLLVVGGVVVAGGAAAFYFLRKPAGQGGGATAAQQQAAGAFGTKLIGAVPNSNYNTNPNPLSGAIGRAPFGLSEAGGFGDLLSKFGV